MKKNFFLVSVIVNCHNGEKYLNRCIKSILSQTYKNWEIIFWNNLSFDNSEKIIKSYRDKRIKIYKSKKFLTLYEARNKAIKKAKGNYICFLDVDDYWNKNKLKKQINFFKKNKSYDIVYSNFYTVRDKKKKIAYNSNLPSGRITNKILKNYCIGILTVCIKRNILLKKNFNKMYNIIGDFDFFLKISLKNKIGCIQEGLAYYQIHKENFSKKNIKLFINEQKSWIQKNESLFKKQGFSLKYQKINLIKLKFKNYLNTLGRVVQW